MSYFTQDNTFVDAEDVSLHPSATRTAPTGSPSFTFAVTGEAV